MPATYPLFPLPDLLLYPQALMPLQLFEPRYVQMMDDMLEAGQGHFVLAALQPGNEQEYFERPPCWEIAGLGQVVSVDEAPGDRYLLVVQGQSRVRILEEAPAADLPYRRVVVEPLPEPDAQGEEVAALREELRSELEDGTKRLKRPEEVGLGWMADVLLVQLPAESSVRLELFSILDPVKRAREVLREWRARQI